LQLRLSPALLGPAYFRTTDNPLFVLLAFVFGLSAYVALLSSLLVARVARPPDGYKGSIVFLAIRSGLAHAACFGILAIGGLEILGFWEMSGETWSVIADDGIRYVVIGLMGIGCCLAVGAVVGGVVGVVASRLQRKR
jgi:hypothetical protein